jgi:hypothetical protein
VVNNSGIRKRAYILDLASHTSSAAFQSILRLAISSTLLDSISYPRRGSTAVNNVTVLAVSLSAQFTHLLISSNLCVHTFFEPPGTPGYLQQRRITPRRLLTEFPCYLNIVTGTLFLKVLKDFFNCKYKNKEAETF